MREPSRGGDRRGGRSSQWGWLGFRRGGTPHSEGGDGRGSSHVFPTTTAVSFLTRRAWTLMVPWSGRRRRGMFETGWTRVGEPFSRDWTYGSQDRSELFPRLEERRKDSRGLDQGRRSKCHGGGGGEVFGLERT